MIIQWVYRGMGNITEANVNEIIEKGIECNWIRNSSGIYPSEVDIVDRLTENELNWHQNKFSEKYPKTAKSYYELTPFISTTAGTTERSSFFRKNLFYPAWLTALEFATKKGRQDGWIFHCYVFVLEKKAVGFKQFSEELRELNIYRGFSPYHPEGEIASKILIPSVQIKCALHYPKSVFDIARQTNTIPNYDKILINPRFVETDEINNVRNVLF